MEKLAIIGSGNMGEALLAGLLDAKKFGTEQIRVVEVNQSRREYIKGKYKVNVSEDAQSAVKWADMILLAVKPQVMDKLLKDISSAAGSKLIISIAAGLKTAFFEERLGKEARIARVMPNTPALVRAGVSGVCGGKNSTAADMSAVLEIFKAVGETVEVEEKLMDAVTALSGSGPAYVFLIIEALSDAGVSLGLSRPVALKLAVATIMGSAKMLIEKQEHPAKLKDMVTSPAGTTIAGLQVLEEGGLRAILMDAVQTAASRARELEK